METLLSPPNETQMMEPSNYMTIYSKFSLQVHIRSENVKPKTKALYAPPSLKEAHTNEDAPNKHNDKPREE